MGINYNYDSKNETAEQYHARIAAARGETSGELAGGKKGPAETVAGPEDATTRISKFSSALNTAVDQARQQRKDTTLDYMKGIVPPGALPASSFAQVLRAFNSDSAPLEASLIKSASDFAQEQERVKQETQNSIKDLALAAGKAGAKQETVDAITALMESGNIQDALKIASTSLGKSNEDIRQVGSNLVQVDADGNVNVLYSAPTGGDGGGSTGFFKSGGLKVANEDLGDAAQQLEATRDWENKDGYANTDLYVQLYQHWVDNGGLPQDFLNRFDPDFYLRPTDSGIPLQIKSVMKKDEEDTPLFGTNK